MISPVSRSLKRGLTRGSPFERVAVVLAVEARVARLDDGLVREHGRPDHARRRVVAVLRRAIVLGAWSPRSRGPGSVEVVVVLRTSALFFALIW